MKVLMVCLGNICRSPMAEGILRHKAKEREIDISTDSCGTGSWHIGNLPDRRAISNLLEKGINISDLRARTFHVADFQEFDRIYCMDQNNYNDILALAPNEEVKNKVKLILNEVNPNSNQPVPDPYYGGDESFELVYNLLDTACDNILNQINEA